MKKIKKLTLRKEVVSILGGNDMNLVKGGTYDGTYNRVDKLYVTPPAVEQTFSPTCPPTCATCATNCGTCTSCVTDCNATCHC